jgi:DNA-binding NarL/FixJ family response regulator
MTRSSIVTRSTMIEPPVFPPGAVFETPEQRRKARVFIVEDHPFVREGIVRLVNRQNDLTCCGEAESIATAADSIAEEQPDLLLLDLILRDGDGLELIGFLKPSFPTLPILVLSQSDDVAIAERALRAGASGFVAKHAASEEVLNAIRAVLMGRTYVSNELAGRMLSRLLGR